MGFPERVELFRWSGCLRNAISVVCALEHKEIHSVLPVRKVTADFERFSDRDPQGFALTYPAWHRNSLNKEINQRKPEGAVAKKDTRKCMKQTRHNDSVWSKFVGLVLHVLHQCWKVHSTHQDVSRFERPSVSRVYGRKQCRLNECRTE